LKGSLPLSKGILDDLRKMLISSELSGGEGICAKNNEEQGGLSLRIETSHNKFKSTGYAYLSEYEHYA
jgi:hypothetical protein